MIVTECRAAAQAIEIGTESTRTHFRQIARSATIEAFQIAQHRPKAGAREIAPLRE
jgi:hypothetical protein